MLIHAGRGIPALGADTAELARRHPGARMILAHAGISDLAWIWREAAELSNLYFDSSWWSITDLVTLFALVPPGQILYASDAPYGFGLMGGILFLRAGLAVGLEPEVLAQMAGGADPAARRGRGAARPRAGARPAPPAARHPRGSGW